jgi:hypothetical protein
MNSDNSTDYTLRVEASTGEYKDQMVLITKQNDSMSIGPAIFNIGGSFRSTVGSRDSVFTYPTYTINNTNFTDLIRVKVYSHYWYSEVYYAKFMGLVAVKEKNGRIRYVKRSRI